MDNDNKIPYWYPSWEWNFFSFFFASGFVEAQMDNFIHLKLLASTPEY